MKPTAREPSAAASEGLSPDPGTGGLRATNQLIAHARGEMGRVIAGQSTVS